MNIGRLKNIYSLYLTILDKYVKIRNRSNQLFLLKNLGSNFDFVVIIIYFTIFNFDVL